MPKVELNTRAIVSRLRSEGWIRIGGAKHDIFMHPQHEGTKIILPRHREQSFGVAHAVAKLAGWK
jgi:predicted RNA binding protein YcfA (HicA-like mRNA interferase family)